MISKLLIIFLNIFTHVFTVTVNDKIVTNKNSHNQFDVNKVECVGRIIINDSFRCYVYKTLKSNITFGDNLKRMILYYFKEIHNIDERSRKYKDIEQLVNVSIDNPREVVRIESLTCKYFPFNW